MYTPIVYMVGGKMYLRVKEYRLRKGGGDEVNARQPRLELLYISWSSQA